MMQILHLLMTLLIISGCASAPQRPVTKTPDTGQADGRYLVVQSPWVEAPVMQFSLPDAQRCNTTLALIVSNNKAMSNIASCVNKSVINLLPYRAYGKLPNSDFVLEIAAFSEEACTKEERSFSGVAWISACRRVAGLPDVSSAVSISAAVRPAAGTFEVAARC